MDEVDFANNLRDQQEEDSVAAVRRKAAAIPAGEPGDCDRCGEYFARTVNGYCGRCRDKGFGKVL